MPCHAEGITAAAVARLPAAVYTAKDGLDPEDVKVLKTFPIFMCFEIFQHISDKIVSVK